MRLTRRTSMRVTVVAICAAATFLASPGSTTNAAGPSRSGDGIGTPKFEERAPAGPVARNAITIPSWSSSYTDPSNGRSYTYTMVGTDPSKGDVTTTIPTVIIPIDFTFSDGVTLAGSDRVTDTVQSPVFRSADIGAAANATASAPPVGVAPDPRVVHEPKDVTQVGDAIYRAQFGKSGSGWHVVLGSPTVQPAASIAVPRNQGFTVVGSSSGSRIGLMSISWFSSQLSNLLAARHVSARTLPIFLVDNTFLYISNPDNCCVLGYHGATTSTNGSGRQQVNTYMFAAYSDQGIFSANAGDSESYIADVHALSHEVQEWYDDPFVDNVVNPWLTPTAPQYGCTSLLETGDPVVGYGFEVTMPNGITYHPEDEVHFSWFARESPSQAAGGYYTYLNNFAGVAQGC